MSAVGGHLHIFRVVRTTHRNVKRVNRILLQVTERIEPLSCDEMQLQLGCDSGEPQYEPVLLARAVRVAVLRANGCSAGIGVGHSRVVARLATRRAKPSGDGVHFAGLETCSLKASGRVLPSLRVPGSADVWTGAQVVDSAAAEHLRNDLGCPDRCHGSKSQSIQAEVNWGVRLDDRRQAGHLIEDVCKRLLKKLLAEDLLQAG